MSASAADSHVPALVLGGPLGLKGLYPYGQIKKQTHGRGWTVTTTCGVFQRCTRRYKTFQHFAEAETDLEALRVEYNAYSVFYWVEDAVLKMINRKYPHIVMLFDYNQIGYYIATAYHWCPVKFGELYYTRSRRKEHVGDTSVNIKAHRLLFEYFDVPCIEVDHVDGNGLNNCLSNLRDGSNGVNNHNHGLQVNNTSGFVGIRYIAHKKIWAAAIHVNGQVKTSSFSISLHGDQAKAKAIAWRQAEAAKVGNTNGQRDSAVRAAAIKRKTRCDDDSDAGSNDDDASE